MARKGKGMICTGYIPDGKGGEKAIMRKYPDGTCEWYIDEKEREEIAKKIHDKVAKCVNELAQRPGSKLASYERATLFATK